MTRQNQKQSGSDTVVMGAESFDALWAATLAATPRGRPSGEGWKNAAEIQAVRGGTISAAERWARLKFAAGVFERKPGTVPTGHGCFYYRPKAKQ